MFRFMYKIVKVKLFAKNQPPYEFVEWSAGWRSASRRLSRLNKRNDGFVYFYMLA